MTIDLHSDTVYKLYMEKSQESLDKNPFSVDGKRMKEGFVNGQCFALFTPTHESAPSDGLSDFERLNALHDRFVFEMKRSKLLHQAKDAKSISEDKTSAILTIEDLGPFEGVAERLELLPTWGVLIASLTWNYETAYAYPNSKDSTIMSKGLKEKGFEALSFFKEHNIVADVSHLNDGGFWDVIEAGVRVMATHSNCRAITNVSRNLTDEMIKALADKGGVAGLNFCPSFLSNFKEGEERISRISDMVTHVMHAYKVGGEDVLALGTDFDGIGGTLEISSPDKLYLLWDALKKAGLSERIIDKMKGLNALRVLS